LIQNITATFPVCHGLIQSLNASIQGIRKGCHHDVRQRIALLKKGAQISPAIREG